MSAAPGPYPRMTVLDGGIEVVLVGGSERPRTTFRLQGDRLTAVQGATPPVGSDAPAAVEAMVDDAVTGLVAEVAALGDEIDALGDDRGDLAAARRRVARLRRVAMLQRDVVGRLAALPHLRARLVGAFERMGTVVTELDVLREEIYETASDRREEVMRRLTILAVVFLPLTVVSSFFGQNFEWLAFEMTGLDRFLLLGVALPLALVAGLFLFLRRRRWL